MIQANIRHSDGRYGPSPKNSYYYKPNPKHGVNSRNSEGTNWCIKENAEFSVFIHAESHEEHLYCNENNCYFSIIDNGKVMLGQDGQKVAKFPVTSNCSDAWHGYPVRCITKHDTPSEELLDLMVKAEYITDLTRSRIERGKY